MAANTTLLEIVKVAVNLRLKVADEHVPLAHDVGVGLKDLLLARATNVLVNLTNVERVRLLGR
eukprot:6209565-Pleurochrysis_carterae.AAC.2